MEIASIVLLLALRLAAGSPSPALEPGAASAPRHGAGAEPLARRGELGVTLGAPEGSPTGAPVLRIGAGSAAERAGLRVGDRISRIGAENITDQLATRRALAALRAVRSVTLAVARGGKLLELELSPTPVPREKIPGLDVLLGAVITPQGYRLRSIVTKPTKAAPRLPGLLLVSGLSCDSVESHQGRDGFAKLIHGVAARSGFVFLRVDKAGVGDSEGPPCDQADFQTELAGYRAALAVLRARPDVDPGRIFILGVSQGAGFAPLIAAGSPIAGYVASGAWAKTWLEHMLELERRHLTLEGKPAIEISAAMRGYATFYDLYLNGQLTPAQVIARRPDLAPLWHALPAHQYGRPAAYFHQLQRLDVAGAWSKVCVPVLSIHGEQDMDRDDQEMIVALVNRNRPGAARFVEIPRMDHFFLLHDSAEESYRDDSEGVFATAALDAIVDWLRQHAGMG
jgi:pimeloyl-ACP methyl ester carboxylesterase